MPDTDLQFDFSKLSALDDSVLRSTGSPGYGVTGAGFSAKPFGRLILEKMALAQELFGQEVDLTSGSVIRKLLEVSALEDARMWAALSSIYDSSFLGTAAGESLSRLGADLGLPRPFMHASGRVQLKPKAIDAGMSVTVPRGSRMLSVGGHHVATTEEAVLNATSPPVQISVEAFYAGPEHNLDPSKAELDGTHRQKIDHWHPSSPGISDLSKVEIVHSEPLKGGEARWPDVRYRQMLLRAPRSIWTVDAVQFAVSQIPGVRQVKIFDPAGGLDINQSIFGNFSFLDRVFASERDLASPYYFTVLVAPTPAAIWTGPDGLKLAVESVLEDLRPIGIFPNVKQAEEVYVAVTGNLVVEGIPLPSGTPDTINRSTPAQELRARINSRLQSYIDNLRLGQPIRVAEVTWCVMSEPGIVDFQDPTIYKFPGGFPSQIGGDLARVGGEAISNGKNVGLRPDQIPVLVDSNDPNFLRIV